MCKVKHEAVIFDMDGIIIDSEPLWEQTEKILLRSKGKNYIDSYRGKILGLNQRDSARVLKDFFKLDDSVEDIINQRLEILLDLFNSHLNLKEGISPLLSILKEKEIPTALASSSPLKIIDYVLKRFDLSKYFDTVISGECVKKGKPHPEIYTQASKLLKKEPNKCIAIEDSINGVKSAKRAGMYCIAIPDERITLKEDFYSADEILQSTSKLMESSAIKRILNQPS